MPSTRKKSTKAVTKKQYEKWESSIIADNNRIVPCDGEPKLVKRRKVMIVCDFQCAGAKKSMVQMVQMLKRVTPKTMTHLPPKHRIHLHHIGNNCPDAVSLGYERKPSATSKEGTFVFKHPATDFGGLTNLHQLQGESVSFLNASPFVLHTHTNATAMAKTLMRQWLIHSQKKTFANQTRIHKGLHRWVLSVQQQLKDSQARYDRVNLSFYALPDEIRMVYTSNDIYKRFGQYYKRTYTGDAQRHATRVSPDKHTYCSISHNNKLGTSFITPNLNVDNLMNEYVPVY